MFSGEVYSGEYQPVDLTGHDQATAGMELEGEWVSVGDGLDWVCRSPFLRFVFLHLCEGLDKTKTTTLTKCVIQRYLDNMIAQRGPDDNVNIPMHDLDFISAGMWDPANLPGR